MTYLKDTFLYRLFCAKKKMVHAIKSDFHKLGITDENYITLHFIYENAGITQAELSDLNQKDRNVIVKTIDKLESMQLVERRRSTSDRRSFCLYVTEEGERVVDKYWGIVVTREQEALSALSEDEQKTLKYLLEKMTAEDTENSN